MAMLLLQRSLLLSLLFLHDSLSLLAAGQEEVDPVMDPGESKAVFDVLTAINSEIDWRALFPGDNPCTGGPHGLNCDLDEAGRLRVIELNLGWVSDIVNNPPCAANASIHPSILRFSRLRKLFFYQCFYGQAMTIPPEVSQLRSLLHLTFQDNSALVGGIPRELANLTSLERLVLTENRLDGPIPTELGKLSGLKQLVLSHNLLSGTIPRSLARLSSLMILDLSSNRLVGSVPPELESLSGLEKMDLSSNLLDGTVVVANSLRFLDLSFNNFSGGIPEKLAEVGERLEALLLRGNPALGGGIPGFVGTLRSLEMLSLSGSGLSGAIPDSIGGLERLNSLALDGNGLIGAVPASMAGLESLYHLNLSFNRLSGKLPFSRQFFSRLGRNLVVRNNSGLCHGLAEENEIVGNLNSVGIGKCEDDGESQGSPSSPSSSSSSASVLGWDSSSSSSPTCGLFVGRFLVAWVSAMFFVAL